MKKKIDNFEDYEIFDDGSVFSIKSNAFLKGSIGENGYKYYRLSKNNHKYLFYAHRLVATAFIDNYNNEPVVNHIDGNKLNNNVSNLEWVSYSLNTKKWHKSIDKIPFSKTRELYDKDLEGELWEVVLEKPQYSISNMGRVINNKSKVLLKPSIACGYYKVCLSENGVVKDYLIHHLVYKVFNNDDNLNNYVIDHIDGNKLNNRLDNLRKISCSENVKCSFYEQKTNKSCKTVGQYDLFGNLLNTFLSTREASRQLNIDASSIAKVCRGNTAYKSCGGFVFKYL